VLNRPFVGPLGIEPEPYEASLKLFDFLDQDFQKIAAEESAAEHGQPGEAGHKPTEQGAAEPKRHE